MGKQTNIQFNFIFKINYNIFARKIQKNVYQTHSLLINKYGTRTRRIAQMIRSIILMSWPVSFSGTAHGSKAAATKPKTKAK